MITLKKETFTAGIHTLCVLTELCVLESDLTGVLLDCFTLFKPYNYNVILA